MKVNRLTLRGLTRMSRKYNVSILCKQLTYLPTPEYIRIGFHLYKAPLDVIEFSGNLTWGQRLFMATNIETDIESFLYFTACYCQGLKSNHYDEAKIFGLFKKMQSCKLKELYPYTVKLVELFEQLIRNEKDKLYRPMDKKMLAAEVERLNIFSEFQTLEYLANRYKCKRIEDALNIPYDMALTMLYEKKESEMFQERYNEILKNVS